LENARVELEKESRKIYYNGINIAYQLYAKTKDRNFIHDAFVISEKSKSVMLLENIRDSRAKSLAGVPDSLIELERDVKITLAYYQSMLHQAQKSKDTAKVVLQEKNIFETQQQYDQLKNKLEKQFLAYFNFKYNQSAPSLDNVRQSLPDEATAIAEFYVEDSVIYKFTISKNNFALERISNDETFRKLMGNYEKSLTNANFILNSRNEADQLYTTSAFALYELLLKSTLENNKTQITKLIIIPDDMLAQFNFGTLLTKKIPEGAFNYKNLEYLTKTCQISYAYSSALINDAPLKRKNPKYVFAGFAPSYLGNQLIDLDTVAHPIAHLVARSGNLPLPGAAEEVRLISQFMDGDSWINQEATETNFKTHAADYGVLHLAMHSLLNNENPHYSELLFNHDNDLENDGYLNVAEIYNLKLNAAMVVLSACSSGFGKIQKGEGPISISRAFSYAGCPSVVMSLWKIPDAVTSQIMTNFYQELKNGKQKDEALRLAQLKFLNETGDPLYHHPYFWAGFVVMGDTDPLPEKFPVWIIYGAVVLLMIILIFLDLRRRRAAHLTRAHQEAQEQPHV
jgi:CHAT domain-containing protein